MTKEGLEFFIDDIPNLYNMVSLDQPMFRVLSEASNLDNFSYTYCDNHHIVIEHTSFPNFDAYIHNDAFRYVFNNFKFVFDLRDKDTYTFSFYYHDNQACMFDKSVTFDGFHDSPSMMLKVLDTNSELFKDRYVRWFLKCLL